MQRRPLAFGTVVLEMPPVTNRAKRRGTGSGRKALVTKWLPGASLDSNGAAIASCQGDVEPTLAVLEAVTGADTGLDQDRRKGDADPVSP